MKSFLAVGLTLLAVSCASGPSLREEDYPWQGLGEKIQKLSAKEVAEFLAKESPGIWSALEQDSKREEYRKLWGESLNFDENAKATIVASGVIEAILARGGEKPPSGKEKRVVHAGLEHTYGYLFSTLPTPFGYKRARWVRDDIESGFHLPKGFLGPKPKQGTLFSNVTYFFGRIAFRNDPKERAIVEKSKSYRPPQSMMTYPYFSLKVRRLEETVQLKNYEVQLRTDFVEFPYPSSSKNEHLLIYSVWDSRNGGQAKLITGFPVEHNFAAMALDETQMGFEKVQSRYNAWIPGLTDSKEVVAGDRRIK